MPKYVWIQTITCFFNQTIACPNIYASNFCRVDLTSMKRFPLFSIRKISDLDFLKINESYFAIVIIDFYFIGYYFHHYNVYFQVVENNLYSNLFRPSEKLLKFLLSFQKSTFGFENMYLDIDGFHWTHRTYANVAHVLLQVMQTFHPLQGLLTFFHREKRLHYRFHLPLVSVRNPDLGLEVPKGDHVGANMILVGRLLQKLMMIGRKQLTHFCKILVLQE